MSGCSPIGARTTESSTGRSRIRTRLAERFRQTASLAQGAIDETAYAAFTGGKIDYAQIAGDAFGNAIGDSIEGLNQPNQPSEQDLRMQWVNDEGNADTASGSVPFLQDAPLTDNLDTSTFYQPSADQIDSEVPLPSISITAQPGESITTIMDSSDPVAVEAFQHANDMSGTNFNVYAGQNYALPGPADWAAAEADGGAQGQATLNASEAMRASELQPVNVTVGPLSDLSQPAAAVSTEGESSGGYGNIAFGGMPVPTPVIGLMNLENSVNAAVNGMTNWLNNQVSAVGNWLNTSSTEQNASYWAAKGWVGGNTPGAPTYSSETNGQRLEGPIFTLAAVAPGLDAVAGPTVELTDVGLGLTASKALLDLRLGISAPKQPEPVPRQVMCSQA